MSESETHYDVREWTGNPEHASVDDVVELEFERVQHPRVGRSLSPVSVQLRRTRRSPVSQ